MKYSVPEINSALKVLFGVTTHYDFDNFTRISYQRIKQTFKKMALKCHPDRAASTGKDEEVMTKKFRDVQDAYSIITECYHQTKPEKRVHTKDTKTSPKPTKSKDFYYKNSLAPSYNLRFGEFLYYNKVISWNTLIEALVHHKSSDKLFGSYFVEKKILTHDDIQKYLKLNRGHNLKIKKKA